MDTFGARSRLSVGDQTYEIFRLAALEATGLSLASLPRTIRILLENTLRAEAVGLATREEVLALARWVDRNQREIPLRPSRVLLQDFTGIPALVDLAAVRDAVAAQGADPALVDPKLPVELVVDHSIQVDAFGTPDAAAINADRDYARNAERYTFLKWARHAFPSLSLLPPDTGICHQVNLERLARVVMNVNGRAFPDVVVGTDSHTPMVNGLGVLGWGVGGIEAEAAMLGQPLSLLVPDVVGCRLTGALPPGATATDLVLTLTALLRAYGVVGSFVEFFGEGAAALSVEDRATVANMAPEYGATCAYFPIDRATLDYLRTTGRSEEHRALVEAYTKEQGLWADETAPTFSGVVHLDLTTVEPCMAGPRRPQERVPLATAAAAFHAALPTLITEPPTQARGPLPGHGTVVIAAITSCTNTSNPAAMVTAGLLARNAVTAGLVCKPWVKTSFAPGSPAVTRYLSRAGLTPHLDRLGFHLVGYGCTTCIGNSGPLPEEVSRAIAAERLVAVAVLSGNRNFEGRIHPEVRASYLMSPALVVAFALAGRIDVDLTTEPIGVGKNGQAVFLRDLWPSADEVSATARAHITPELFAEAYGEPPDARWEGLSAVGGARFGWVTDSTYIRRPPFLDGVDRAVPPVPGDIQGARVLALFGDSVTTDHISPAGTIRPDSPAGEWLLANGVPVAQFNSYGSRRGNHEVMVRGTFANVRLRNLLVPGVEGGFTRYLPDDEMVTIYEAARRYREARVPLLILAGKDYGAGSSRDWAAKGTALLGGVAVIARSYERIHRSNLVGMGVLPLQFMGGDSVESLGLDGTETYDITGLADLVDHGASVSVTARRADGTDVTFQAYARLDSSHERALYRHGGVLPFVLRQALGTAVEPARMATAAPAAACPDGGVEEGSKESFPASDPPAY